MKNYVNVNRVVDEAIYSINMKEEKMRADHIYERIEEIDRSLLQCMDTDYPTEETDKLFAELYEERADLLKELCTLQ